MVHLMPDHDQKPDRKKEDSLSRQLGTIPHDFHYLHDGDVVPAIHNFLEATDCNGLVTIAHEHSLMYKLLGKSVSRSLAQQMNVPMLVLHDA